MLKEVNITALIRSEKQLIGTRPESKPEIGDGMQAPLLNVTEYLLPERNPLCLRFLQKFEQTISSPRRCAHGHEKYIAH